MKSKTKKPQCEIDYEFQKKSKKYKKNYFTTINQLHVMDDISYEDNPESPAFTGMDDSSCISQVVEHARTIADIDP